MEKGGVEKDLWKRLEWSERHATQRHATQLSLHLPFKERKSSKSKVGELKFCGSWREI